MDSFLYKNITGFFFLTVGAIFDCISWWLIKSLFNKHGLIDLTSPKDSFHYIIKLLHEPKMIIALTTFFAGPVFSFLALNRLKLIEVYPWVIFLHVFFIFVTGYFLLNEEVSYRQLFGVVILVSGVFIFYSK